MYRFILILLFIAIIQTSCYRPAPRQAFADLKALEGTWTSIEGPVFNESWKAVNDSLLKGVGFALNQQDTSFKEILTISRMGNEIVYAAKVSENRDFVFFKMEEAGKGNWSFNNPDHDYPNIISYKLINDSLLETRTTNSRGNKEIKFVLKKVKK